MYDNAGPHRGRRIMAGTVCVLIAAATSACDILPGAVRSEAAGPTTVAGPRRPGSLLVQLPPPVPATGAGPAQIAGADHTAHYAAARAVPAATSSSPSSAVAVVRPAGVGAVQAKVQAGDSQAKAAEPPVAAAAPASRDASAATAAVRSAPAASLGRPAAATQTSNLDEHYRRRLGEQQKAIPASAAVRKVAAQRAQPPSFAGGSASAAVGRADHGRDFRLVETHYRERLTQSVGAGTFSETIAQLAALTRTP